MSFSWLPCLVDCLLGATPWCSGQHSHISGDVRLTGSSGWMWEWKVVCPDDDNVDIHIWSEKKWYVMLFDFFATVFNYFLFLFILVICLLLQLDIRCVKLLCVISMVFILWFLCQWPNSSIKWGFAYFTCKYTISLPHSFCEVRTLQETVCFAPTYLFY